ncbi:hypothetical protein JCM16775_0175 [Leptotrichia hofstadii]|uniref:Uncharacterized protein n=2 Tax=Leptotrichia hofstadii TaxID=157688 RepID=A0A510JDW4_9FUSO|nr:hypothetical protein [Leptotrichia hofstadii]BBM37499.1 hypothetical protein JCM16775_0175 [Leptotrichia hofstadii]
MEELTTKEYNELYKKYFKEIFNKPMKDFGYKKKGTGRFCKLNKIGLFEYIGFFRYYHELRVEYAIIPIYSYIMKDTIGNGSETEFVDLDGEEKMEKGMKSILEEIKNKIIPWFKKYEDLDVFFEEVVENDRKYFWPDIYKYLFRATTFAKFKKYSKIQENIDKVREEYNNLPDEKKTYDFYKDILKEVDELEEKLKEGEESLEKHIKEVEYKSLLAWKMEKLLKK